MKLPGLIIILKSNKILLACIVLLAIFTIGAVSACDENITESDNDILSIDSGDENVIEKSAGDFCELTDLVNQTASGKTLYLDKDYVTQKILELYGDGDKTDEMLKKMSANEIDRGFLNRDENTEENAGEE